MMLSKLEVGIGIVLLFLLTMEFYLKQDEVMAAPELIFIGIALGFSMGFKLAALHGGTVSKKALDIVENQKRELTDIESKSNDAFFRLREEMNRKDKLISSLKAALADRDDEVKYLVKELSKLKEGGS